MKTYEKKIAAIVTTAILLIISGVAQAGLTTSVGRNVGRATLGVEFRELASLAASSEGAAIRLIQGLGEEGAEAYLKSLSPTAKEMIIRHGERGAEFFMKTGPQAEAMLMKHGDDILRIFESKGAGAADWVARYGDDGVIAANRFGVVATEQLVSKAGIESLPIVLRTGHHGASILKRNPEALPLFQAAAREGSEKTLLDTIERGGDRFFQFAQRNWKGITVASLCAAFITQPEIIVHPAFNAAKEVGKTLIESIADLLKDTGKSAAKGAFDALTNPQSFGGGLLTFIVIVSLGLGGLWMILGCFRKKNNSEDKKSCLKITNPA